MKNNKNAKRLDGKKILVALTNRLEADMRSFRRDKNIESESELIRQAIGNYIYSDYADETLKLQGMNKIQEQITELRDMIDIVFKYLVRFHISMLAYHPEIDGQFADAAYLSAVHRHDKFFNAIQESLRTDPPLFERLLHKYYSEDGDGKN
ncbi:hypothetical protein R84B8_01822 [Treponema sp. R8-4-B8]